MDPSNARMLLEQLMPILTSLSYGQNKGPNAIINDAFTTPYRILTDEFKSAVGNYIPFGGLLAPMLSNMVFGRGFDSMGRPLNLLSSTLLTNNGATLTGASIAYDRFRSFMLADSIVEDNLQGVYKREEVNRLYRTLNSEKAFLASNPGKTVADYERTVQNQVDAALDNPLSIYSLAADLSDLSGIRGASKSLSAVASRLINYGGGFYDRQRNRNVSAFITELFAPDTGSGKSVADFYSRSYSGFDMSTVAALAKSLVDTEDPMQGITNFNPEAVRGAAERFRSKLQQLTKAIEPLRDVFGKDVPAMLSTIEGMTGMSVGQVSLPALRTLSENLTNSMQVHGYTIAQIAGTEGLISAQLDKMPYVKDVVKMGSMQMALDALNSSAWNNPYTVRKENFQNFGSHMIVNTASSRGADVMNQLYAIWADQQQRQNKASDMDTFTKEVLQRSESGQSPLQAALDLTGVNNSYEARRGTGLAGYTMAAQANLGGLLALRGNIQLQRNSIIYRMSADTNYRSGLRGGADAVDTVTAAIELLSDSKTNYAGMNEEDLDAAVRSRYSGDEADNLLMTIRYLRNNNSQFVQGLSMINNLNRSQAMQDRVDRRRKAIDKVRGEKGSFSLNKDFFMRVMKDGLTDDKLLDALEGSKEAASIFSSDVRSVTEAVNSIYGTKADADVKAAAASSIMEYALSSQGLQDKEFQSALDSFTVYAINENDTEKERTFKQSKLREASQFLVMSRVFGAEGAKEYAKLSESDKNKLFASYLKDVGKGNGPVDLQDQLINMRMKQTLSSDLSALSESERAMELKVRNAAKGIDFSQSSDQVKQSILKLNTEQSVKDKLLSRYELQRSKVDGSGNQGGINVETQMYGAIQKLIQLAETIIAWLNGFARTQAADGKSAPDKKSSHNGGK